MNTTAVIDYIVDWLKTYLENSSLEGFVVGVSGGVDSAVTSILAAKTGYTVYVVDLPIHQEKKQHSRAQAHIAFLKERFSNVIDLKADLGKSFDLLINTLDSKSSPSQKKALSQANTRSRLRMTALYYYAGLYSGLVVGTGNKIEDFGIGFYTKYGDGGVDLSPIADLTKTNVYTVAKNLDVLESIQKASPTDGLWEDNRSDEEQIGASYSELEWAMEQHENGQKIEVFQGRQKQVYAIFIKLNKAAQHKINPIPICKIPHALKN